MATKPTTTTKAAAPAKLSVVDSLIIAAGKAGDTMLAKVREAAKLAAKELDGKKPLAERIAAVMTAHSDAFKTAGHNVRALFSDALTLLACGGDRVTIAGPKNSETTMAAKDAVDQPKHAMRAAARDVREDHGMGRKVAPKVAPVKPAIDDAAMVRETLAEVADLMSNADFVAKLTALLGAAGYIMAPKAKTANKAKGAPVAPVKMADLPVHRITGAANMPAPF